jgi:hypothetical protein
MNEEVTFGNGYARNPRDAFGVKFSAYSKGSEIAVYVNGDVLQEAAGADLLLADLDTQWQSAGYTLQDLSMQLIKSGRGSDAELTITLQDWLADDVG